MRKEVAAVSAAVKRMQMALANLRLWMALIGQDDRPSIHPERVIEAIGALEAGLAVLRGEEPPAAAVDAAGEEPAPAVLDEQEDLPMVDEDIMIAQIQEQVMKQGVALPIDVIAMVLEAEEDFLYDHGVIAIDFAPDESEESDESVD
jgi:hypothetical protein